MREIEIYSRASASTLRRFEPAVEGSLSSSLPEFAESWMSLNGEDFKGCELFFAKVTGEGMTASGIFPDDMLVVDQSLKPQPGDIVICQHAGEFVLRSYHCKDGREYLLADNTYFKPVDITGSSRYKIWGVVPHGVIDMKRRNYARIQRFEKLLS